MKGRILITGANGFIGSNLLKFLKNKNFELYGWSHANKNKNIFYNENFFDIQNEKKVLNYYKNISPDFIIHLAGFSSPVNSWSDPQSCFQTNLVGTINLIKAIENHNYKPKKFFYIGTSGVYNNHDNGKLIKETSIQKPMDPYSISKYVSELYINLIKHNLSTDFFLIRPFSIVGEGKKNDFCSDVARQIVSIERGTKSDLEIGELNNKRDFLDIRDAVTALYLLILDNSCSHREFNLCSGKATKLNEIIKLFCNLAKKKINIIINRKLIRKNDNKYRVGNNTRLTEIGWRQKYELHETIESILNFWRNKHENI